MEGRKSIGIELNPRYAELAKQRLQIEVRNLFASIDEQQILQGDSRDVLKTLEGDCVDFVVTSPPYWNILHKEDHKANQERKNQNLDTRYSDNDRDLGNVHDYDSFLQQVAAILGECGRCLRPKKYMAVVVSDFREKSRYITFHSDLANALLKFRLELRGIKILYQRHKRVFPYGYPFAYVPNIHHQYILIMQNMKA